MAHAMLKVGAVLSSVAIGAGVIWYQVGRVGPAPVEPSESSQSPQTVSTQTPMLMAGSKSKVVVPAEKLQAAAGETAGLKDSPKSHVVVPVENDLVGVSGPYVPALVPASSPPGMLMSSSKTIIFSNPTPVTAPAPETKLTPEQAILMYGSKSGAIISPTPPKATTKPATSPATVPATAPKGGGSTK